jgi:hypothetical protein
MSIYSLLDDNLPYIGIIDPRTGAAYLTINGFIEPDRLSMTLFDFIGMTMSCRVVSCRVVSYLFCLSCLDLRG